MAVKEGSITDEDKKYSAFRKQTRDELLEQLGHYSNEVVEELFYVLEDVCNNNPDARSIKESNPNIEAIAMEHDFIAYKEGAFGERISFITNRGLKLLKG